MTRHFPTAVLAILCVVLVALCAHFAGSLIDDAYIFFRYADNVLAGHGPVYNPGERVEGFTSPLWLALLVAAAAAGIDYEAAVPALGTLFAILGVVATWSMARRVLSPWFALVPPAVIALHPGFTMWAVHGLETSLFVVLIVLGFQARSSAVAGLILGLAFWTRPEAGLVVVILAVTAIVRRDVRRAIGLLGGFAVLTLPLQVFRIAYYGDWVPNTFYAKTGGGAGRILFGLAYAGRFVMSHVLLVVCAAAACLARFGGRKAPRIVVDAMWVGIAWSAYVIWVGGDAFPGYRFWLPVLPLAGLVAAWVLEDEWRRLAGRSRALVAVLGVVVPVLTPLASLPDVRLEHETGREFTARMVEAGTWLRDNAPEGTTLALNYVGAVPYHAGLPAIDMLGLTDRTIARTPIRGRFRFPGHARGNGGAVLDRRPDLILMNGIWVGPEPLVTMSPQLDTEEQIATDPRFAEQYELVNVRLPGDGPYRWFAFYRRTDLAWEPAP